MTLDMHTLNELAWALETTQIPPHVSHRGERLAITREYARLYQLLRAIDLAHRGKSPIPSK